MKKRLIILTSIILVVVLIVMSYIFGWRLFGFKYCYNPNYIEISDFKKTDEKISIKGYLSMDSASTFQDYCYEIEENVLKIGLKYDLFFGKTSEFDITIDAQGKTINRVVLVDGKNNQKVLYSTK